MANVFAESALERVGVVKLDTGGGEAASPPPAGGRAAHEVHDRLGGGVEQVVAAGWRPVHNLAPSAWKGHLPCGWPSMTTRRMRPLSGREVSEGYSVVVDAGPEALAAGMNQALVGGRQAKAMVEAGRHWVASFRGMATAGYLDAYAAVPS